MSPSCSMGLRLFRCLYVFSIMLGFQILLGRSAQADEFARNETSPHVIKFSSGFAPATVSGFPYRTYLSGAHSLENNVVEALTAYAWMEPEKKTGMTVSTNYPTLRIGDVAPVFGRLYRVEKIVDQGEPKGKRGKDWMSMTLAETTALPPGLSFHEGSIAIPLGGGANFMPAYATTVDVAMKAINVDPGDNRGPVAEITATEYGPPPAGSAKPYAFVTQAKGMKVRSGATVDVGKHVLKVCNIVPRDEKHRVIGWIELDPGLPPPVRVGGLQTIAKSVDPAKIPDTFPDLLSQLLGDAGVGTTSGFEKLLKDGGQRAGLIAPAKLFAFLTQWHGCSITKATISFSVETGEANLSWNFYVLAPSSPSEARSWAEQRLPRGGFSKGPYRPTTAHLRDLYDKLAAAGLTPPEQLSTFSRRGLGATEEVALLDRIRPASPQSDRTSVVRIDWTVARKYRGEPPTLKQLLESCAALKWPYLEPAFFDMLKGERVFAYHVSFPQRMADWMVEVPDNVGPALGALLRREGFHDSQKPVQLHPPFWPAGTEQRSWLRIADWTDVSLISLPERKRMQLIFQSPQKEAYEREKRDATRAPSQ
jgi:hypothetical protein